MREGTGRQGACAAKNCPRFGGVDGGPRRGCSLFCHSSVPENARDDTGLRWLAESVQAMLKVSSWTCRDGKGARRGGISAFPFSFPLLWNMKIKKWSLYKRSCGLGLASEPATGVKALMPCRRLITEPWLCCVNGGRLLLSSPSSLSLLWLFVVHVCRTFPSRSRYI